MIVQIEKPILSVNQINVSYYKKTVLSNINFTIPKGKLVGIIGPNGAGKSTLIKAIMQLVPLDSGYIQLFGKSLSDIRTKVGYVPQRESVDWDFPISVLEVVLMGMYHKVGLFKSEKKEHKDLALKYLKKVGMENFAKRQISELSGGQQQRVFIARSLAQEAEIYLMDEPFAGVDVATEQEIIVLLKEMRNNGRTILVVHHDLQSVTKYFDWVVMLNSKLIASAPTEEVFTQEVLQETYGGKIISFE